ncbi:MAG: hypothetical protein CM1200mP29_05720 [Verrucomicrobiota bacterium]|nr:MAG: hypothetical protein CM1200mP29_05720 [Verrucomicrobiota bacterium]
MLSRALGRDAIYFDYVTSVEEALGKPAHLAKFEPCCYTPTTAGNEPHQWTNLKNYVENGGGFVPVIARAGASATNQASINLSAGGSRATKGTEFAAKIVKPDHPALKDVKEFTAWDETYFHANHNPKNRTVLMVRDAMKGDPHTKPEPWTWVRTQGKGRIFYTASGHDQRVWNNDGFHQLLKSGILWAVGDKAREGYENFLRVVHL